MAWCAISLRAPSWLSPTPSPSPSSSQRELHIPRRPARPTDVYNVQIVDPSTRSGLLKQLRNAVTESGRTVIMELVEGRRFMFLMPKNAPISLTGYQIGGLMEEGGIQVTKTVLDRDDRRERCDSVGSSDEEEDVEEHPNLRMQWTWSGMDGKR